MKKLYIGINAHKASNCIALAFKDMMPPGIHGKGSADRAAISIAPPAKAA